MMTVNLGDYWTMSSSLEDKVPQIGGKLEGATNEKGNYLAL